MSVCCSINQVLIIIKYFRLIWLPIAVIIIIIPSLKEEIITKPLLISSLVGVFYKSSSKLKVKLLVEVNIRRIILILPWIMYGTRNKKQESRDGKCIFHVCEKVGYVVNNCFIFKDFLVGKKVHHPYAIVAQASTLKPTQRDSFACAWMLNIGVSHHMTFEVS